MQRRIKKIDKTILDDFSQRQKKQHLVNCHDLLAKETKVERKEDKLVNIKIHRKLKE